MEDETVLENSFVEPLVINELAREYLRAAAKWAKFISIFCFVLLVLMCIGGIFMGVIASLFAKATEAQESFLGGIPSIWFSFVYLVIAIIYVFPIYYLYKFSRNMIEALDTNNVDVLTNSFRYLKSHYKYISI